MCLCVCLRRIMLGWVKRVCSERRMHSRAVLEHACIQRVHPCVISECVFLCVCVCLHAVICCIVFVGFMMTASRNTQHNKLCIAMRAHAQRESQLGPGAEIHEFFGASLQNLTLKVYWSILGKKLEKKINVGSCVCLMSWKERKARGLTALNLPMFWNHVFSVCVCMYVYLRDKNRVLYCLFLFFSLMCQSAWAISSGFRLPWIFSFQRFFFSPSPATATEIPQCRDNSQALGAAPQLASRKWWIRGKWAVR